MSATYTNGQQKIESFVGGIKERGINTDKNVNIGVTGTPNLWVAGNVTVGGTISAATGSPEGVVAVSGATLAPAASASGTTYTLGVASGTTVTLPTAALGLSYTFIVTTSVTSNADKITVGSSNGFLIGLVQDAATVGGAVSQWVGNGSTHISVSMNGTTTGGLQGSYFTITCVAVGTTPLWLVDGNFAGSGTLATPFITT